MAGQASGSRGILIVCILLGDVWADAPPLVEIASPRDGSTLCEGDPLPFLVRLGKGAIPRGAYAEVLLDSKVGGQWCRPNRWLAHLCVFWIKDVPRDVLPQLYGNTAARIVNRGWQR